MLLFRTQPGEPWTKRDFLLLEAYQIVQDERCPECGLPAYLCRTSDPDLQFRVRQVVCNAAAAVKRAEKRERGLDGKKELEPGLNFIPEPYSESGRELTSFREPFYAAEAKRREALNAPDEP